MNVSRIECPDCKRVGEVTMQWTRPGVASGPIMEGLDPENCHGCRAALAEHGYATVRIWQNGDGTGVITTV